MRKLLCLLILLLVASSAFATQITVPTLTVPNFQITGLGNPTTGTATVTNGVATVTSSAAFPARLVGLQGYKIVLGGFEYEALSTESASSLTLTQSYAGASGSVAFTIYPVVLLQIYTSQPYFPLGASYPVLSGARGSQGFYKKIACSFKYFSGVPSLVIPQITLDAISDAPNNADKSARLSAYFFRVEGGEIRPFEAFQDFTVQASPTTQQWEDIRRYNLSVSRAIMDNSTLTRSQIYDLLSSFNPNISGTYRRLGMIGATGTGVENSNLLQDGSGNISAGANLAAGGAFSAGGNITTSGNLIGGIPGYTLAELADGTTYPCNPGNVRREVVPTDGNRARRICTNTDASIYKWVPEETVFRPEKYGADPTDSSPDGTAILTTIAAARANGTSILDTIGGNTITAYTSGVIQLGFGVYRIPADTFQITQDLGLTIRGMGSRGTNNAIRAPTTILITGTSSGYGIKLYRGGARSFKMQDLDLCYETSGFTGSLLDVMDTPGVTLDRVFIGTYGLTGGTRLQTAAACVRLTYDEFFTARNCVFDGAALGIWSDDVRSELSNTFGGSVTTIQDSVFYDFSAAAIQHAGNRTREALKLLGNVYNPISVDCVRSVDLNNVDAFSLDGGFFTPSTTYKATTEWLRLVNVTGTMTGATFGGLSKAGSIYGQLTVSGCKLAGTDGLTLTGGAITASSNEFASGVNGYTLSPSAVMTVKLGPDLVKSGVVNYSYDIPSDSANLGGVIHYDSANDASGSKFRNTSQRIKILNVDGKNFTVSSTVYTASILDTGRNILATGAANQVFTLPEPTPGTELTVTKLTSFQVDILSASASQFYTGLGAASSSITSSGTEQGGSITFVAYASVGWLVKVNGGNWSLSGTYKLPNLNFPTFTANRALYVNSTRNVGASGMVVDDSGNLTTVTGNTSFTSNFISVGAASASSGNGGNLRFRDDTGTSRWLLGHLGSGGATGFALYDLVNSKAPINVSANAPDNALNLTTATVGVGLPIAYSGTPQTLTGAGAVSLTTSVTYIVTTGANALTLADAVQGQIKTIRMKTDGGDGTLTPTNKEGFTTVTFNDVGDTVTLQFLDGKWNVIGFFGVAIA